MKTHLFLEELKSGIKVDLYFLTAKLKYLFRIQKLYTTLRYDFFSVPNYKKAINSNLSLI